MKAVLMISSLVLICSCTKNPNRFENTRQINYFSDDIILFKDSSMENRDASMQQKSSDFNYGDKAEGESHRERLNEKAPLREMRKSELRSKDGEDLPKSESRSSWLSWLPA